MASRSSADAVAGCLASSLLIAVASAIPASSAAGAVPIIAAHASEGFALIATISSALVNARFLIFFIQCYPPKWLAARMCQPSEVSFSDSDRIPRQHSQIRCELIGDFVSPAGLPYVDDRLLSAR